MPWPKSANSGRNYVALAKDCTSVCQPCHLLIKLKRVQQVEKPGHQDLFCFYFLSYTLLDLYNFQNCTRVEESLIILPCAHKIGCEKEIKNRQRKERRTGQRKKRSGEQGREKRRGSEQGGRDGWKGVGAK